ncbi:MAG: hydroxymethylglutaryl-CoA reductase, degradative [Lachnospiraceae bacterium]|nr:hydroxymethylglutaryl-CoA reductase, degradative [Lachnospiraceae bacterium]
MEIKELTALQISERIEYVKSKLGMSDEDLAAVTKEKGLSDAQACEMIENVIGTYSLPYSIAPGFLINGREYIVPMVTEEPYVVSSTINGALLAAKNGGFICSNTGSVMYGQIQLTGIRNPNTAGLKLLERKAEIIEAANKVDPVLVSFGGGCFDVEVRPVETCDGPMLILHLVINTADAMGAQAINAMAEAVSPLAESITGGRAIVRVLSNRAFRRLVRARVTVKKEDLGGEECVDKVVSAYAFADADPYRAVTNNKGVMNGIIPVVVATGNDTRAVESGVHSYACRSGQYKPITIWEKDGKGNLCGMIEIPMAIGTVGGTTRFHPGAQFSLKLMSVNSAARLAEIIAATGLAANLGVLYSLVTAGLHGDFEAARK